MTHHKQNEHLDSQLRSSETCRGQFQQSHEPEGNCSACPEGWDANEWLKVHINLNSPAPALRAGMKDLDRDDPYESWFVSREQWPGPASEYPHVYVRVGTGKSGAGMLDDVPARSASIVLAYLDPSGTSTLGESFFSETPAPGFPADELTRLPALVERLLHQNGWFLVVTLPGKSVPFQDQWSADNGDALIRHAGTLHYCRHHRARQPARGSLDVHAFARHPLCEPDAPDGERGLARRHQGRQLRRTQGRGARGCRCCGLVPEHEGYVVDPLLSHAWPAFTSASILRRTVACVRSEEEAEALRRRIWFVALPSTRKGSR